MTTPTEFRNQILSKAAEDGEFRGSLLSDPAAAISSELGISIPDGLNIQVHEDGQNVVNLVLPPKRELAKEELEQVAGGLLYDDDFEPGSDTW